MAEPQVDLDQAAVEILKAFSVPSEDLNAQRDAEKTVALQAVAYVLGRMFKTAEEAAKDGVFSLGFKVTFDRNEFPTEVKAVARCSQVHTADISLSCPREEED